MSPELKTRLLEGYASDPKWAKIAEVLDNNENAGEDAAKLPFIRGNDGLFQRIEDATADYIYTPQRLYIPNTYVHEFLDITYSGGHVSRDKCHEIITRQWFILGLDRKLREYIRHCPKCQLYQTQRHQPHGALQPILSPPTPFHTLSIDFILALPVSEKGYETAMSVTCKFLRKITIIAGKSTYTASQWAEVLLRRLQKLN